MKFYVTLLLTTVVALLASCSGGLKDYTITGTFDLPEAIQMGDSLIERGDVNGVTVFLLDIEGEPIDSVMIENDMFVLSGKVNADEPFFAYVVCEWGAGMITVEPGNIEVEMSGEGVRSTGTPLNDDIADLEAALSNAQEEFYNKMYEMYQKGDSLDQTKMMNLYMQEQQSLMELIDSVYQANADNLVGVYAVNLLVGQSSSVEELDEMLEEYSDYVKNSALITSYRAYLGSLSTDEASEFNFDELVPDNNTAE